MKCNQQQWEEIKPLLDKHNIKFRDVYQLDISNYLVNNYGDNSLIVTNVSHTSSTKYGRKVYEEWNKDIFLAACGVSDEFVLPKRWWLKITDENRSDVNYWRRNIVKYSNSDCPYSYIAENGCGDNYNNPVITTEQFYKYVLKKEMSTKQTLTRAQLISLHDQFECSTWKDEIKSILSSAPLATDNTEIEIPRVCIDKLIKNGSTDQKAAVEGLGLKLGIDKSVQVPKVSIKIDDITVLVDMGVREYANKAFCLSQRFNWELKEDSKGALLLIPTKKD